MSTQSTTRCEYCGRADEAVATRHGRGAQAICETCDAWIAERMRETTVAVPDEVPTADRGGDVDPTTGRVLALDPDADATAALEYASGVSYEVICQLETAGFDTVEDLWTAERDDLLAVPHVAPADVEAIVESISTKPSRGLDETLEELDPEDVDELGATDDSGGDSSDDDRDSGDDAEIL
jgi:hypothetical protein